MCIRDRSSKFFDAAGEKFPAWVVWLASDSSTKGVYDLFLVVTVRAYFDNILPIPNLFWGINGPWPVLSCLTAGEETSKQNANK